MFKSTPILFRKREKKWRDVEIIFGISQFQIQKFNLLIFCLIFILFFFVYILLIKITGFLFFSLIIIFILGSFLHNFLYVEIQKRKYENMDNYRFILLNLSLFSKTFSGQINTFQYIFEIFFQNPSLGINIKEKIQNIFRGGNITKNLQEIQFYSKEFKDLFCYILERNDLNNSLISQFDEKTLNKFEFNLPKFKTHLEILVFLTLFFPIVFFSVNLFYFQSILDIIFIILSFTMLLFFLIKRWKSSFPLIYIKSKNSKNIGLNEVIDFFELFSYELQFFSPPLALLNSLQKSSNKPIKDIRDLIIGSFNPIDAFFHILKERTKNKSIFIIIEAFSQILKINCTQGQDFFKSFKDILIKHEKIKKQKELIQNEIRSKSLIFKLVSMINLSILSPFVYAFHVIFSNYMHIFNYFSSNTPLIGQTYDLWYFLILPLYFLIITLFSFNTMVSGKILKKVDLLFLGSFLVISLVVKMLIFSNFF